MPNRIIIIAMLISLSAQDLTAEPLPLSDALMKGARGNHSLRVTAYDEQLAEDNLRITKSGALPRVDFQGGITAQLEPQTIKTPGGSFSTQQSDYGFFSLGIYQTIYDFGRTDARIGKSRAYKDSISLGHRGRQQDIFLRIVTAYFRILQEESLLKSADEEVKQMGDHLRVARNLFEQGVVTRNDLLQAEVRLASSRQRYLDVRNSIENGWLWLNYLMGTPPDFRAELATDTHFERLEKDLDLPQLVAGRPEFQAQKKIHEASEFEVKESASNLLPELFVKAGVDYVQNDRVKEQAILAATVGLKVNLYEGGAGISRREKAVKHRARVTEQLRQLESEIALEYRTAVNDANVAAERISVTEASIRQGEENLRINRDRYIEKVGTATDVIDAQALLTQIRMENAQAVFDYELALARVKRARGEL